MTGVLCSRLKAGSGPKTKHVVFGFGRPVRADDGERLSAEFVGPSSKHHCRTAVPKDVNIAGHHQPPP